MMGERHGSHGELQIGLAFHPWGHSKGGADQETGTGLTGQLHILQYAGKFFAGQLLSFGGKDAEPGLSLIHI